MEGPDTPTIYITPGATTTFGTYVLASGDSASDLFALGPNNPPVPTRCCSICNGDDYEGVPHTLTYDLALANTISSCTAFSLQFWDEGVGLQGWYCVFHNSTESGPPDTTADPDLVSYHYLPMS